MMRSSINAATLKIRGGREVDSNGRKAGKGALIQWELSGTLGVSQDQTLFVWSTAYRGGGQNINEVTRTWSE